MIYEQLTPTQKKLRGLIQHVAMHEASIALIRSTAMCKDKQDTLVTPRINAILVAKQEIETLTKGAAMARKKFKECLQTPMYSWAADNKASRAAIRHALIEALEWRAQIAYLPMWREKSCTYLVNKAEHDAKKSLHQLARSNLEYLRMRARLGTGEGNGYPWDRIANELWAKLNANLKQGTSNHAH